MVVKGLWKSNATFHHYCKKNFFETTNIFDFQSVLVALENEVADAQKKCKIYDTFKLPTYGGKLY